MFQSLTGLYEPSAIQQLEDERFLVVEDEKNHPFSLETVSAAGDLSSRPLLPLEQDVGDAVWKLDDLEALKRDAAGYTHSPRIPATVRARQRSPATSWSASALRTSAWLNRCSPRGSSLRW